jgi:Protein of unknown function (DUF1302)
MRRGTRRGRWARAGVAGLSLGLLAWASAAAELYRDDERDLRVALDTTVSVGASLRVEDRNCKLVYTGHGGCNSNAAAINNDDGDLNYDNGDFYSAEAKATTELEVDWRNFGAFARAVAFYDFLQDCATCTRRTPLAPDARYRPSVVEGGVVGAQFQLLDMYVNGSWDLGERPLDVRLGNQLVSWGENLFIPGGINQINAVDVSRLRVPGSEIKEALLPAPMLRVQTEIVPNLGVDAYYQFYWNRTYLDPTGSYFSTSDLTGRAAQGLFLPVTQGLPPLPNPNLPADPWSMSLSPAHFFAAGRGVPRLTDDKPPNQGQGGVALRYFVDPIQTEFGLYYLHYHSKTPVIGFSGFGIPAFGVNVPAGFFRQYAPDVDLVGASFATQVMSTALAGEVSYRWDEPVAINALDGPGLLPSTPTLLDGFVREKRVQIQVNAIASIARGTHFVGPIVDWIAADDITVVGEVGAVIFPDLSKQCPSLPNAQPTGCRPYAGPSGSGRLVDAGSWGYQLRLQPNWSNPFSIPIKLQPFVSFQHDVQGTTPGLLPFIGGRMGLSVGADVIYLDRWTYRVAYANFFGAGRADLAGDRDFVSFSVSYAF